MSVNKGAMGQKNVASTCVPAQRRGEWRGEGRSRCSRVSRQAGAEVLVSVLNLQSNKAGPLTPRQKRPLPSAAKAAPVHQGEPMIA